MEVGLWLLVDRGGLERAGDEGPVTACWKLFAEVLIEAWGVVHPRGEGFQESGECVVLPRIALLQEVLVQLADESGQLVAAADLIIWSKGHVSKYPVAPWDGHLGGWLWAVFVTDHAAEAGAGGGEVVLKLGDSLLEFPILSGRLPFCRGQPEVLLGELVHAVDQVVVAELFDLLSQMSAGLLTPVITAFADFSIRKRGGDDTRGLRGGSGSSTSQRRNRARSSSVIRFQSMPRSEHQVSSRAEQMPYAFSVLNDRPMSRNEARNRQDSW